jgi:hypothetical protein
MRQTTTAEVRRDDGKSSEFQRREVGNPTIWLPAGGMQRYFVAARLDEMENYARRLANPGNVG